MARIVQINSCQLWLQRFCLLLLQRSPFPRSFSLGSVWRNPAEFVTSLSSTKAMRAVVPFFLASSWSCFILSLAKYPELILWSSVDGWNIVHSHFFVDISDQGVKVYEGIPLWSTNLPEGTTQRITTALRALRIVSIADYFKHFCYVFLISFHASWACLLVQSTMAFLNT